MQELRIVLIVVGIILIIALLAHGFWSSRKQRPEKLLNPKQKMASKESNLTRDEQGFDDLGVGEARVIGDPLEDAMANFEDAEVQPVAKVEPAKPPLSEKPEPLQRKEPEFHFSAVDDAPQIADDQGLAGLDAEPELAPEQSQFKADEAPLAEPSSEPEFAYSVEEETTAKIESEPVAEPKKDPNAPDDVFIVNVMAQSGRYLKGPALMASLNKIGMRYGDMDIFHRHLDNSGSGPIIFSLANMVNPGTFDLDNIEQLETRGVSIFMTVPCKGEPTKNFALMYKAASTLAKELDAIMLDDQRNPLTKQTVNHYEQRVREYERKQLLVN